LNPFDFLLPKIGPKVHRDFVARLSRIAGSNDNPLYRIEAELAAPTIVELGRVDEWFAIAAVFSSVPPFSNRR
jgi:hypothetical protein